MAFGDFGLDGVDENDQQAYNFGESCVAYNGMQYDPNTGECYDYSNWYVPYDNNCYGMMNQDGMMDQGQIQDDRTPEDNTQVLLTALGENIGDNQTQVLAETIFEPNDSGLPMNGNSEKLGASGQCELNGQCELELDGQAQKECWDGSGAAWGQKTWECSAVEDQLQNGLDSQQQQQQPASHRRGDRREARETARRSERAATAEVRGAGQEDGYSKWNKEVSSDSKGTGKGEASGNITTVMLRNIPNKYTREMLVKQLEQDMYAQFDFIYLPIDFKNKCNVGYAFINFTTIEACDLFVSRFNGVEVRKCLPGLNSRKITEVTPARVQGFEDNVARLRNSPVMRELVHKPEWMPVVFDADGNQLDFPAPERPLEAVAPRRRTRYEQDE